MADGFDIDTRELEQLAGNIGRATAAAVTAAHGVIAKGALNIKNDTRANISDHPSWKKLKYTVDYEQVGLSAVVGYNDRGQGNLAGIYEFGSALKAPHPTLYPAAAREAPKFAAALEAVVAKVTQDTL